MSKIWKLAATTLGMVASGVAVLATAQVYNGPPRLGTPLVQWSVSQAYNVPWSENSAQRHSGVDLAIPRGNNVYAVAAGRVVAIGDLGFSKAGASWGQYIVVQLPNKAAHGYLHVNATVRLGAEVSSGSIVGTVFKDHLHFNNCSQVAGCQHGAFPNSTYANKPINAIGQYYSPPPF